MSARLSLAVVLVLLLCTSSLSAQIPADSIPPLVDSLIKVSRAQTRARAFDEAFSANQSAREAALNCCQENSAAYAAFCFNEGRIYYFMGRHKEALPWYIQSRSLRGQILGTDHVEYGKSCNNLAITYDVMGRYRDAEPLYLEALAIRKEKLGNKSGAYASVLNNLSGLYEQMGDLERAERFALEVKDIRAELYGTQHPAYARILNALGRLNYRTNNLDRANQYYLQAKAIHEAQTEINYPSYILVLSNLGALHQHYQNFKLAEEYYNEAAQLQREIWGTDFYEYALSLNHLAAVYQYTDRLPQAEANLLEALAILERLSLEEELYYGLFLQNLGDVYLAQGLAKLAMDTHQNALEKIGRHVSKNHPQYLQGLIALTDCAVFLEDYATAETYLRLTAEQEEKNLNSAIRYLSEDELDNYTREFRRSLYRYYTLAETQPTIADLCYDKVLFYKGFLLNTVLQLNRQATRDDATKAGYQQLREKHQQLAKLYSQADYDQQQVDSLEWEATELEKSLIRQTTTLGQNLQVVRWSQIKAQLQEQEAAIEFMHYRPQGLANSNSDEIQYVALLLLPNVEQPIYVSLSSEKVLQDLLQSQAAAQDLPAFINSLYGETGNGSQLYQAIWAPIAAALELHGQPDNIYFSTSGLLHRVSIAALPTPEGKQLSQLYNFRQLSSTRVLAKNSSAEASTTDTPTAALYGGIDYGEATAITSTEDATQTAASFTSRTRSYQQRGYDAQNGFWQPLPWTEVEVTAAEDLLLEAKYNCQLMTGTEATELSLKRLSAENNSPRILHLATHGYFFPDKGTDTEGNDIAFRQSDNSMIRSGLILADANYSWANGQARKAEGEDGILTAYEVSQLDLQETELVILSACETGLGDIQDTEGVYGLQRAFKIAGTRYIIMTLWQIPDFETQTFMSTFYLAWLDEGKSIPEAFKAAQSYMRARYNTPFQWAPFVLLE